MSYINIKIFGKPCKGKDPSGKDNVDGITAQFEGDGSPNFMSWKTFRLLVTLKSKTGDPDPLAAMTISNEAWKKGEVDMGEAKQPGPVAVPATPAPQKAMAR